MSYDNCLGCSRVLVNADTWKAIPIEDRDRIYKTHARRHNATRCHGCRPRDRQAETERSGAWRGRYTPGAVVIAGGWWIKRGLTLVPVGPRPSERADVKGWTE